MKAVIFDMDGVIIDSEPTHFLLERQILEELGARTSKEDQEKFVGTTDQHIWSSLKKEFKLKPSVEDIIQMKKERFYKAIPNIPLVDGFLDLIERLSKEDISIGIASSNNRDAVERVVESFNLETYVDFYISGEEVEKSKPNPEIFLKCAKSLGVEPESCLVIEDAHWGVEAAKEGKMKCIGYRNPNSGSQDLSRADLIVETFYDLSNEKIKELFKD